MSIESVKTQLLKQRSFKSKISAELHRTNGKVTPAMVELKKDIEALDYAIRLLGELQRGKKNA